MSDTNIKAFMSAAADLMQSAVNTAKADSPDEYAALVACVKAGGMVSIKATMSPTTGIAQLGIDVIEPNGTTHRLMSANLERESLQ
jgi:hypothetical protein